MNIKEQAIHKSYYIYRQDPNDPIRSKEELLDVIMYMAENTVDLKESVEKNGAAYTATNMLESLHHVGSRGFLLPQQPFIFNEVVHRIDERPIIISPFDVLLRLQSLGLLPKEELSAYPPHIVMAIHAAQYRANMKAAEG